MQWFSADQSRWPAVSDVRSCCPFSGTFCGEHPADTELEITSRAVGIDRVIDEFIYKVTPDSDVD